MWYFCRSEYVKTLGMFFVCIRKVVSLRSQNKQGSLAEWLGTGLQNRLRRFESARNLKRSSKLVDNKQFRGFFIFRGRK